MAYYNNTETKNPYQPGTPRYQQWQEQNGGTTTWAAAPGSQEKAYVFDPKTAFSKSGDMLERYYSSLPTDPAVSPDLTKALNDVGAYEGFDWGQAGEELKAGYKPPTYNAEQYDKTNYDFADRYDAPDDYEGFDFTQPDVGELSSVQPMAKGIWDTKKQIASDEVGDRYKGIMQRTRDEIIRTGGRPEQAAAIMSNVEFEKDKAIRDENRRLAVEEASQNVGIAQKEQELGLQRNLAVAGMDADTQERMANELAKTYGMNIDAARYMVEQQAKQQQAQAGENQADYAAKSAEARYGYEQGTEAARYQSAMDQWTKEQQAAEAEKVWQSRYGLAQDTTQATQSQWQADQAAKIDLWNAQMQGIGAAQTGAAQEGTYWGNLEKGERDAAKKGATPYYQYNNGQATGNVAYGGAGANTPAPSTNTGAAASGGAQLQSVQAPSGYSMPKSKTSTVAPAVKKAA